MNPTSVIPVAQSAAIPARAGSHGRRAGSDPVEEQLSFAAALDLTSQISPGLDSQLVATEPGLRMDRGESGDTTTEAPAGALVALLASTQFMLPQQPALADAPQGKDKPVAGVGQLQQLNIGVLTTAGATGDETDVSAAALIGPAPVGVIPIEGLAQPDGPSGRDGAAPQDTAAALPVRDIGEHKLLSAGVAQATSAAQFDVDSHSLKQPPSADGQTPLPRTGTRAIAGVTPENSLRDRAAASVDDASAGGPAPSVIAPESIAAFSSRRERAAAGHGESDEADLTAHAPDITRSGEPLTGASVEAPGARAAIASTPLVPPPQGGPDRAALAPLVGGPDWAPALGRQLARIGSNRDIELSLNPAELGPLKVRLSMGADSQTNIAFVSEHSAVRQALEAALPQLRTSFADNGVSLGQTTVGSGSGEPRAQSGAGQQPAPHREPEPQSHDSGARDERHLPPADSGARIARNVRALDTFA